MSKPPESGAWKLAKITFLLIAVVLFYWLGKPE